MLRKNLECDVLYFDVISGEHFYTPVPEGVIWLSDEEAREMFDEEAIPVFLEVV